MDTVICWACDMVYLGTACPHCQAPYVLPDDRVRERPHEPVME